MVIQFRAGEVSGHLFRTPMRRKAIDMRVDHICGTLRPVATNWQLASYPIGTALTL